MRSGIKTFYHVWHGCHHDFLHPPSWFVMVSAFITPAEVTGKRFLLILGRFSVPLHVMKRGKLEVSRNSRAVKLPTSPAWGLQALELAAEKYNGNGKAMWTLIVNSNKFVELVCTVLELMLSVVCIFTLFKKSHFFWFTFYIPWMLQSNALYTLVVVLIHYL